MYDKIRLVLEYLCINSHETTTLAVFWWLDVIYQFATVAHIMEDFLLWALN